MEKILGYVIMAFGFLAYVAATVMYNYQKKQTRLFINEHNRKVILGIEDADWDKGIEDDCIPSDDFFLLENSGTYDTSFLASCQYKSFINDEDLFWED